MAKMENNEQIAFDKIRIGLASPEKIREWSRGEVTKPETINYRTLKPEKDGLFCEKIFGPSKDYECHCGKYKKIKDKGTICDRCGVEITKSSVRRERMGSIELSTPVSHIWYFKGIPSRMGLTLDISPKLLEKVLYFASYIVLDPKDAPLDKKQILNQTEYASAVEEYGADAFEVGMGAEAIKKLLEEIDVDKETKALKKELDKATGQKRTKLLKRVEVFEAFKKSGNKPEWMVMDVIPVIPPDLRPMVQLDGGRFATSDMNDLYRRIINRNNRLKNMIEKGSPDIIVRNEKRMLQEAVDSLIDNGRRGRAVTGPGNRPLKSLSDMLKGKQGRFRQNLLGKRVDYSGRSVIVVGPELKIYQCGLPKEMAIELFKPFVMKELTAKPEDGVSEPIANNIKAAKKMVDKLDDRVWDVLEDVIKEHPVMLNRAPTLHRLGIQAFEPVLVEGKAIKLHPLVCTAFNADFDGDQMAVHLPLSAEAQAECRFLLLSPNNLLKPSDGAPVAVPSQDMILGLYYLTMGRMIDHSEDEKIKKSFSQRAKVYKSVDEVIAAMDKKKLKRDEMIQFLLEGKTYIEKNRETDEDVEKKEDDRIIICTPIDVIGPSFSDVNQAILAYENKDITLHQKINVRRTVQNAEGKEVTGMINTTLGRLLFNEVIPQDLGFVERKKDEDYLQLEVDETITKKTIKPILERVINIHGATKASEVLDNIKAMGYKYSTQSGITVSVSDMTVPDVKEQLIAETDERVEQINASANEGFVDEESRYENVVAEWKKTDDMLTDKLMHGLDKYNNINIMAVSGARGSQEQIKQLAGMRGLMAYTSGKTIELPIKSNFREGLDVLEYFISAHGARKGLSDTALRTADSGYLTRRLVDVSQELIIREEDCCDGKDIPYMEVRELPGKKKDKPLESLGERIVGRVAAETIKDKKGNVIVKKNHTIYPHRRDKIIAAGIDSVKIRTVLTCKSKTGICAKCYGANMATGQRVQEGEAVGIIAAQSIGEPGTQLTMRTFHTGGVAGDDITQGLPRVEELFEARKPKGLAILSEIDGRVSIKRDGEKTEVVVNNKDTGESKTYLIPYSSKIVEDGNIDRRKIEAGFSLTEGNINPHDLLRIKGLRAVQDYMITEVQKVYRAQGVDINDKHIEVIVRQMLKKVTIEDPGDSNFLTGSQVEVLEFEEVNEKLKAEGKTPATGTQIMLGITKASLATNSFLSAASFQETTRVLTDAAIKGRIDPLIGIKENVLIGKLIPAGTGMKRYNNVHINTDDMPEEIEIPEEALEAAEEAEATAE
ncbi:MAG: DNA-directed RNA polymerase subunit beta' [Eubacterium sp.]|nr:DNA-directed RNA polymerase subunit beta' [Eubacterium sp.]